MHFFLFVISISKNGSACSRGGVEQASFCSPPFLSLTLSLSLPPWTQAEPSPCCRGFMIYVSWSVTPNQHWLAEWRRAVSNTRQTIQIQSWTLELIANIQRESGQSVSLRLFKSVSLSLFSLYLSFCLSGSQQLNLAVSSRNRPKKKEKKNTKLQEPACLCCYSDVSL